MIRLYSHNKKAYDLAVTMLEDTKKAAIVHPTGTGKSFIAFKLCEDHPDKTICWLSPSEYIFSTQLENLYQATNGYKPHNIVFFTYAKLMGMSKEEIQAIHPDYIVLDEYHRAGATYWQKGVEQLLFTYADVPVLGLSATNIRYLDSQRDMAQELFDGNIASQMSLGEAIVRGILNPPKYVLSMYYYQNTLEKYERRVKKTKSKVARDNAEKCLEELRRTLEKAEGLDVIFKKHMTDPHGKYIVFCSNKEHMDQMMKHTEWFSKVDKEPHMYSVYSSDPGADKVFKDFKGDNDNNHLRLLYCIDALNEGIHVDDINGVILLRPTVSPIVYKQQIGRALSASKKTNAVIFDIVLNIENIYSIDSIKEEMQVATSYYRSLGEADQIINEKFKVIDEVRNCRELFEKLNDALTATWDMYYASAKQYYKENGNLEVPARYITEEGYALGSWLNNQKAIRKGTIVGKLTEDKIQKLNSIGMIWDSLDYFWEQNFRLAKEYYLAHGNLDIPTNFKSKDGKHLGNWILRQRQLYKSNSLTDEQIKKLDSIGMDWMDRVDRVWENGFIEAKNYSEEYGNLSVPKNYRSNTDFPLGIWIQRQRSLYKNNKISEDRFKRLTDVGMNWNPDNWESRFNLVKQYYEEHGNINISQKEVIQGIWLGKWIVSQKKSMESGKLTNEQIEMLKTLPMEEVGRKDNRWWSMYEEARKYYLKFGHLNVPMDYITSSGKKLSDWIIRQRRNYKLGKMPLEHKEKLDDIGFVWDIKANLNNDYVYKEVGNLFMHRNLLQKVKSS
ncbi:helicase [Catenibacterium sp. AM22-15]|uniref:Helicase associated domain protein n=1 Tax=unclassified Catenibacterium TaxID=2643636 RepID=UPI000E3F6A9E|nr:MULTISPECIES: Helicase associated domain protein [unclassified Catenibacterium]RGE98285.1 helicase [Catenibacterium sp. AM22-6LB]RGF07529.1 helicase [Catenibacterium sp. AM22-15]